MNIGDVIKKNRLKLKKSQEELSTELGLTKSTISMYETGKRLPKHSLVPRLCLALDINPNTLYGFNKKNISSEETDVRTLCLP